MGTELMAAEPTQQFDFTANKVQCMNLDTLKRTVKEKDYDGNPVKGIYHYEVIERVGQICDRYNLNWNIHEIFASSTGPKAMMGVSVARELEEQYGERAVEAHILRRVFATIDIRNWETDELTTALAISFHQDGLTFAIGPCVKICHNQCILGDVHRCSTYGSKDKLTIEQMFERVDGWLRNFETEMTEDRERIRRLKSRILSPTDIYLLIGMLVAARVTHDSTSINTLLRDEEKVKTYPLNQAQISAFTENMLYDAKQKSDRGQSVTAWDVYNIATEIYKPGKTDFPSIIPQNAAMAELILDF